MITLHPSEGFAAKEEEARLIARRAMDRGILRGPNMAAPVAKDGTPAASLGAVRTQWMDVDSATAKRWLENNFHNRNVTDDVVHAFARDMLNGIWLPTHQGVAFNDRDELIDGQHRLAAIVLSGVTVRMMVTFGLPSRIAGKEMTTMDAVDRGRTRSVADQLKIQHGLKAGTIVASVCASLANLCCGERTRRLTVGQTLDIYRAFEQAVDYVVIHRVKQMGLRTAGLLAGFAFALATEEGIFGGATPIGEIYHGLLAGKNLAERSAIKHLRVFLTSDEARLLTRGTNRGVAELALQAIYLELNGRRMAKLGLALDGVNHFRGLQRARIDRIAAMFRLPAPAAERPAKAVAAGR
jgi:hypothetical protein